MLLRSALLCLLPHVAAGLQLTVASAPALRPVARVPARCAQQPMMFEFDASYIAGIGALAVGLGGGIGLIALTESAGKRNEDAASQQPCVECKGSKVSNCPVCRATGQDQYASLVASVQAEVGEETKSNVVLVDDWDSGPKQVELFADILAQYPVKVTENICQNCDGRGVVICDNCQGTGIQPRFLERYSPDDFMD